MPVALLGKVGGVALEFAALASFAALIFRILRRRRRLARFLTRVDALDATVRGLMRAGEWVSAEQLLQRARRVAAESPVLARLWRDLLSHTLGDARARMALEAAAQGARDGGDWVALVGILDGAGPLGSVEPFASWRREAQESLRLCRERDARSRIAHIVRRAVEEGRCDSAAMEAADELGKTMCEPDEIVLLDAWKALLWRQGWANRVRSLAAEGVPLEQRIVWLKKLEDELIARGEPVGDRAGAEALLSETRDELDKEAARLSSDRAERDRVELEARRALHDAELRRLASERQREDDVRRKEELERARLAEERDRIALREVEAASRSTRRADRLADARRLLGQGRVSEAVQSTEPGDGVTFDRLRDGVAAAPRWAAFVATSGDKSIEVLVRREVVIGRGGEADLRLGNESVSAPHARMRLGPDGATIEDLASTNGTEVDGVPLVPRVPAVLRDRSVVRFGTIRVRVHLAAATTSEERHHGGAVLLTVQGKTTLVLNGRVSLPLLGGPPGVDLAVDEGLLVLLPPGGSPTIVTRSMVIGAGPFEVSLQLLGAGATVRGSST